MDTTLFNLIPTLATFWFPEDGSAINKVDAPAIFILWICGIFLVFNATLMVYFAWRYRQKKKDGASGGATHNTTLEVTWSIIPAFILAIIFVWGFRNYMVMATPPDDAYDIMVTGYSWGWNFTYDEGFNSPAERDPETDRPMPAALHVPAGVPVRLTLQSQDVIHSVFIPQLRVKKDCVPGRFNQMWFEAEFNEKEATEKVLPTPDGETVTVKRNTYDLFCTEYCGQNHSMMITKVYVYQPDDYELWKQSATITDPGTPLTQLGETIWATQCKSCHSIDGSGTAQYPSWLNLYGDTGHLTSAGPVDVNDEYIIESIIYPAAKIVDGYNNQMPAFPNLKPRELRGIIEFMKSVSDKVEHDDTLTYGDLNAEGELKDADGDEGEGSDSEADPDSPENGSNGGDAPPANEYGDAA